MQMMELGWPDRLIALQRGWRLPASARQSTASRQDVAKRGMDLTVTLLVLLAVLPVLGVIALALKLEGGPVMYGHRRIGRGGRSFACLKFRSMVPNAGEVLARLLAEDPEAARSWAESRKLPRDPRVTRLGAFLRATSLDELPQLFNVLRGEMSLVGPRPVVAQELEEHYGEAAETYKKVRPGITGLWQVSGRSDTSYSERVALDCRYVQNASVGEDLRILLRTVPAVLLRRGAY